MVRHSPKELVICQHYEALLNYSGASELKYSLRFVYGRINDIVFDTMSSEYLKSSVCST